MSNVEKRQDGLNGLIEELLVFKPDIDEAMDNYDDIARMVMRGIEEMQSGISLAMAGVRTLKSAQELLKGQNNYNREEACKRIAEIMRSAERGGLYNYLLHPTLRVMAGDPNGGGGETA